MADIMPPPTDTTCQEFLGKRRGYCPHAAQVTALDGRGFCPEHAKERAL